VPITAWRASGIAAFVALAGITLWLLDQFARHEFSMHLRGQAAHALALAASGGTPFDWRFRTADDLVAGHPFGTEDFEFADGSLRLQLSSGPVEIGLPLARPLDLQHFLRLHAAFDMELAGELRFVMRETLQSPETISEPIVFSPGSFDETYELGKLGWTLGNQRAAVALPERAAMLRLRFSVPAHSTIVLKQVELQRRVGAAALDIGRTPPVVDLSDASPAGSVVYRIPFATQSQQVDIAAIATSAHGTDPALILLPARGRVEQQIALRNAVYAVLPTAILIPESAYAETFAAARELTAHGPQPRAVSTHWHLVALFGAMLVIARLRPPRNARWRALVEIVLTLAAPMWLILGGDGGGNTWHSPQRALIALTIGYAISLSWPRTWRWNGTLSAWRASAAVVVLALMIGLLLHRGDSPSAAPGLHDIGRYLGWALLQQYLICAVCAERWRVATGNALLAAYFGALGFALLHTPNAALMLATFVGGLCWCAIYLRHRALLPVAFSHAASAVILSALLPADILLSAEVSARFFQ
jgi:hypothetical protein